MSPPYAERMKGDLKHWEQLVNSCVPPPPSQGYSYNALFPGIFMPCVLLQWVKTFIRKVTGIEGLSFEHDLMSPSERDHITVRWRLKSPESRLFTQPFVQTQIKENIKAPRHWPLWGEFTGDSPVTGEFPAQRASNAENVSIWWRHHEQGLSELGNADKNSTITRQGSGYTATIYWIDWDRVWASCQIRKIAGAHAPGMPGSFSPPPQVSDPDMHHGTCMTHLPWCMLG